MGLLDFASDPEGMQGLSLLAAAGPSMQPMNFASRLAMAGNTYRGLLGNQMDQQLQQARLKNATLDLNLKQQAVDRMNAIRNELASEQADQSQPTTPAAPTFNTPQIGGVPMFSQGTSVSAPQPAQSQSQQTTGLPAGSLGRATAARLLHQADIYSKYGDFENANKLYESAVKFMPEVKEMGVLMQNGKPVNVITYKDGTQQITDLAPKPDVHWLDTGNAVTPINQLTMSPMTSPVPKSVSPDAALTDSRERSQFKQTLQKDYLLGGFNPDGSPAGDVETTAKAIASGQLPPPSGYALMNPKNQRILARVMEINPNYDFTDVTAKRKAASDFTSGPLGNQMRSFATAGQHLDQLTNLVTALDNNDIQAVNKISNFFSQQTGNPAVTNFDAAKDVVSKEVMKAIVAGGGGQGEREELQKSMAAAKSPAQLLGVIKQYRNLMGAQYDNLLAQRRAAGLSDSTLPKYDASGSTPQGQSFTTMPPANGSNKGKFLTDTTSGKRFQSNGLQWVEVK